MEQDEIDLSEVEEIEHTWIPMPDGVRLSARLWLPVLEKGELTPAILEYIPYRKRDMVRIRDERNHAYFATHGYACLRVDMRGSGDSEGLMPDMYSANELDDAISIINWIANQSWCDGSVGMMGTSWGGTASLQAAARRPKALKAIIAVCATNNRFDDDIHHMGGCLLTDSVEWGATLPAILASPPDPDTVGKNWREMWMHRLSNLTFPLEDWIRHETRDAYWRWGSVDETPDAIECPTLAIGGWADRYSNTVMNLLADSKEFCQGIVGPWGHHYPDVGNPGPTMGFQQVAKRWWDRWLKHIDNGVDGEPKLRVWMQEYALPQEAMDIRPGHWISEAKWPSANIKSRGFWLDGKSLAQSPTQKTETLLIPYSLAVGSASGDTGYFGRHGGLPTDQTPDDEHSLVFETEPLTAPLEILGSVRLIASLHNDRPVAMLVARLNDVAPGGDVARVSYSVKNLSLDEKQEPVESMLSGEPSLVNIGFPNTAYQFEKGHRIRLSFSCSYWPLVYPSPTKTSISIQLQGSRLTLPVRLSAPEHGSVRFPKPITQKNSAAKPITNPVLVRKAETDATSRQHIVSWHQPFKCAYYSGINLHFGFETSAKHAISLDNPCSASSEFKHRICISRDDWEVNITSTAKLSTTVLDYELSGAVEAKENGEKIFRREWNPEIPRKYS